MTSLLSARKRAEEFAAAVEGGADPTSLRPEMAELVTVVGTLQREAAPAPRPEFTAALRERLMTEAATSLAGDNILALPPRRKGSRERRMAMAASSLVLIGGTAGMAAAAQNALPGEALYPIKRGLEKAQTGLSTSETARGQDLLAQADSRLVEVQGLLDQPSGLSQVPSTIEDFTTQANEAAEVLLDEYEQYGDDSIIEELRAFTEDNLGELQELAQTAPPEHHDELAIAADALMQIAARAEALCPECTSQFQALKMPPLFLTANEARRAMAAAGGAKIDNSHPQITEDAPTKPRPVKDKTDDKPAPPPEGGTDPAPGPGGNTGGTGGTGGDDGPSTPDLPTDGGLEVDGPSTDGPTTGGKSLGDVVDEVTKGDGGDGGDGDGKNTETDKTKDPLPQLLEDVTEVVVP